MKNPNSLVPENRLTLDKINAVIKDEQYYIFPHTTVTICCLTLSNGFNATGESACIDPANFDAEIGQKIARENAIHKVWQLEGYLLKDKLYNQN